MEIDFSDRRDDGICKKLSSISFQSLVTTRYIYSGSRVIAEYHDTAAPATFVLARKYLYGPGIDFPVIMIDGSDNSYYYAFDAQGSVIALLNSGGAVVDKYTCGPFGETIVRDSSGNP